MNDLQMKTKRLNGSDYKISIMKIRYLQVGEFAHLLRGECFACIVQDSNAKHYLILIKIGCWLEA